MALSLSADRSLDSDIMFPERRIVLNADNKSVTIGRASKVSSKGYIAGVDNGWFDSAVMSRQHAKIVVDMDKKVCPAGGSASPYLANSSSRKSTSRTWAPSTALT